MWLALLLFVSSLAASATVSALTFTAGQRISPLPSASAVTAISPEDVVPTAVPTSKISLFDLPAVEAWATERNLTQHHLKTIYQVVMSTRYRHQDPLNNEPSIIAANSRIQQSLEQASFPKRLAQALMQQFTLHTSRVVEVQHSASGGCKLLVELLADNVSTAAVDNGNDATAPESSTPKLVETVVIRHASTQRQKVRHTVCVSSQVGCARACTFCATGTLGLQGQLTSGQILEQVWMAQSFLEEENDSSTSTQNTSSVRNVVFMGQGEPLDNYPAVHEACRGLTHQCLFGLQAKQVTISTVGASPRHIRWLAQDAPQISLALSLHGATPELRHQLMPGASSKSSSTLSFAELEEALDLHAKANGKGAMLEYLLIDGVNDTPDAAQALVNFWKARVRAAAAADGKTTTTKHHLQPPFVNLIPYNPTNDSFGYQTPSDVAIHQFHECLTQEGIPSRIRWSSAAGRDTQGACGQLALRRISQPVGTI